ncbi:MAG: glycine cleavage system aminomethyltransferase GcvT [Actinomycetota bacterium]
MRQIPLRENHAQLGASFTDFGGWEMPVRYTSDLAEHKAVREAAGLFDISHMAEIFVTGSEAGDYLDYALVGKASEIAEGRAKYSLICNSEGGIIDDLIVYRLGEFSYLVIANAANRDVVAKELMQRSENFEVAVADKSDEWVLLALQGPKTVEILGPLTNTDLNQLKYYSIDAATIAGVDGYLARTGYTGEDGFEILLPVAQAESVFEAIVASGTPLGMLPTGLACRDTLRLEAGMPLYGHELNLETNPYQAHFGKVVRLDKTGDFVGKGSLQHQANLTQFSVLVGLRGEGKRAARADYEIFAPGSDRAVGKVTSGALSPTLGYPIAMGYVEASCSEVGTKLEIDIRGTLTAFEVVGLPFYKRAK